MSDSSDDENLEQLKESVDSQFLKNDFYKEKECKTNADPAAKSKQLPSLRRNIHDEDEAFNLFRVTPEFQKYVSKQLAIKLEKTLAQEEILCDDNQLIQNTHGVMKSGIKLLHSSKDLLEIPKVCHSTMEIEHNIKFRNKKRFHEGENDELGKCKAVAIDGDEILGKKNINAWSNRSKAEVYNYKKVNGRLEYQEKLFVSVKYK